MLLRTNFAPIKNLDRRMVCGLEVMSIDEVHAWLFDENSIPPIGLQARLGSAHIHWRGAIDLQDEILL